MDLQSIMRCYMYNIVYPILGSVTSEFLMNIV